MSGQLTPRPERPVTAFNTETEGERIAKERGGVHVAYADLEKAIVSEFYISGEDAAQAGHGFVNDSLDISAAYRALRTSTICIMTVKNGFHIVGFAAPVDEKNFDPNYGRKLAREKCIQQLWPLMGFAKREELHAEDTGEGGQPAAGQGQG